MAYQKRYRTVVPVPQDQVGADEALVWLTRESFERAAARDGLQLVEFTDNGQLAAEDVPPKAEKQLGKPAGEFMWRVFEGIAQRGAG